jgi:RimJ/RimL family protein N-acetyltransferase
MMSIQLVKGKGSKNRGGGLGGSYWHIYENEKRVGNVFINVIDEPPLGTHASIQIHINARCRGKGIGRAAYQLACTQSGHDEVFAYMRKSNLASRKAAEHAGFQVVSEHPQLTMRWDKSSK